MVLECDTFIKRKIQVKRANCTCCTFYSIIVPIMLTLNDAPSLGYDSNDMTHTKGMTCILTYFKLHASKYCILANWRWV